MAAVRRSRRSYATFYTTNGRDYLASEFGCSNEQLDAWLRSSTVRPHLQLWYKLCALGQRRFHEAVEWIERGCHIGSKGYFYDPEDGLQVDVKLFCLAEGNIDASASYQISIYADPHVETYGWSTAELWARSAWRVVQENASPGGVFETMAKKHASRAYALVIDMMSIAFHSIACRRSTSVWEEIIGFVAKETENATAEFTRNKMVIYLAGELDGDPNADRQEGGKGRLGKKRAEDVALETSSVADSEATTIHDSDEDGDFEDPATPSTKATNVKTSPRAPKKPKWRKSFEYEEDEIVVKARAIDRWLREKSVTPTPVRQQLVNLDRP
ncbi:uncharacterized protein CLAFUR5_02367 [Fulvia fulva]|uniref:Uncharacterized protein n=1 Tax=Passalora fulva TaxID=5499 RepID=A0A9Q8LBU3_PASFU|nr:uncharacterized protein CLAFUR5_02367 [Fulvia fulva]UJO14364.1 hypothetical protein CLAFUR5_02367 [Fulvia fulva]